MTQLRNRLLTTMVLAAIAASAIGVDLAQARPSVRENTQSSTIRVRKPRPSIGPFTGEPDAGSTGSPKVSPTTVIPTDPELWLQYWTIWWATRR